MASNKLNKADNKWSEGIYEEILEMIIEKLNFVGRLRFKAVCKPWKRVMIGRYFPPLPELPWLMFSSCQPSESLKFLNLSGEKRLYEIKVPEACNSWCCGSFKGWLVMADTRRGNFLLNPFSRALISLPHQTTIPHSSAFRKEVLDLRFIRKAILFCPPTSDTVCIVVVIDSFGDLYCCIPGDKSWTGLESGLRSIYDDIIFYNDQLYTITYKKELKVFGLVGHKFEVILHEKLLHVGNDSEAPPSSHIIRLYETNYLVESDHKLLLVNRIVQSNSNDPFESKYHFKVYEIDLGGKHLFPVRSLGEQMLFLGKNCSTSVKASSDYYLGFGGDCIYFTDNWVSGVYRLKDQRTDCRFPILRLADSQPVWITPDPPLDHITI